MLMRWKVARQTRGEIANLLILEDRSYRLINSIMLQQLVNEALVDERKNMEEI